MYCVGQRADEKVITLPLKFQFEYKGDYNFNKALSLFDWELGRGANVSIDLSHCTFANYQALSLWVLYIWYLKDRGCNVQIIKANNERFGASKMWRLMGANGLFSILKSSADNFSSHNYKPLFAIRNSLDFRTALKKAESYTRDFDVEYEKTLRYVLSELLYNTLEHGRHARIPSIIQFVYYREKQEISFIIADLGVGIRQHLRQVYTDLEDDASAIRFALNPKVSGTFAQGHPYASKDNAGVGLYLSSNIIRHLHADMHIVSGRGVVHVSPVDVTQRANVFNWPGTFVNVRLRLTPRQSISLNRMMSEFRTAASAELDQGTRDEQEDFYYLNVRNYFGRYAEDKDMAAKIRDRYLTPAISNGQGLRLDFEDVVSAPHSFLTALMASSIRQLGMAAYKRIKVINVVPEIRETIDFILDENTAVVGYTITHKTPPSP